MKKGKISKLDKDQKKKLHKKLRSLKKSTPLAGEEDIVEADPPNILATTEAIRTAVIALRKATEEEAKEKKELFDKDFRYSLQVCCVKIPKVPKREVRLTLPHSLYDDTDDVCLFVRDEVRGPKQDNEATALKYGQIFKQQKIDFIKKVMPISELKQNYAPFEMKRKLEKTYDVFLTDRIISGHVFNLVGKHFIEKRKTAVPVNIKNIEPTQLKIELQKGLAKTTYKQTPQGMTTSIPVATHKHTVEQFVANIESILESLKVEYPGGWVNIKNIYVRPMKTSAISLPLYISEINPNQVKTPKILGPKAIRLLKLAKKVESESKKFTVAEGFQLEKKPDVKAEGESKKKIKAEKRPAEEEELETKTSAPAKKQKPAKPVKVEKVVKPKEEGEEYDEEDDDEEGEDSDEVGLDSEDESDEEEVGNLELNDSDDDVDDEDEDVDVTAAGFVAESGSDSEDDNDVEEEKFDDDDDDSDEDVDDEGEDDEVDDFDSDEEEEEQVKQPAKKQKTEKLKPAALKPVLDKKEKLNKKPQQQKSDKLQTQKPAQLQQKSGQPQKEQFQNKQKFQQNNQKAPQKFQGKQQNGSSPGNKFGNKQQMGFSQGNKFGNKQQNGSSPRNKFANKFGNQQNNKKPFQEKQNGSPGQQRKPFQNKPGFQNRGKTGAGAGGGQKNFQKKFNNKKAFN